LTSAERQEFERREVRNGVLARFLDGPRPATKGELAAECRGLLQALADPSDEASILVADAPSVAERLWDAMWRIDPLNVPDRPELHACDESAVWAEALTGDHRRRDALRRAVGVVLRWCGDGKDAEAIPSPPAGLELADGGFSYRGKTHPLTGRPRQLLGALLASRGGRTAVGRLRAEMGVDDLAVDNPAQVVKGAAADLRRALRAAAAAAGVACDDPLPSTGKGEELTYSLNLQ
jgi:hypothetical protein